LRVVSVGRADWAKGYEYGLAALADLRERGVEVQVRICGHGPMFEAVAFARHQLGLDDCVELLGNVPASTVVEQLAWADVFLHAAVREPFGNAVIEAQAMALPVVCTDAGGLPENVEPGITGLVVPRRDPHALADALAEVAADPDRRLAMGRAGRRRAEQNFDNEAKLDRWEEFFRAAGPLRSAR
jgi:colanic acid/amylovoran biosynthesis glycosyltransferase